MVMMVVFKLLLTIPLRRRVVAARLMRLEGCGVDMYFLVGYSHRNWAIAVLRMTGLMMLLSWRWYMCCRVDLMALLCVRVYDVIRRDPGVVERAHELDTAPDKRKPAVR